MNEIQILRAELSSIGARLAAIEAAVSVRTLEIPSCSVRLSVGEEYAGAILSADASVAYHVILLPGEAAEIDWKNAIAWAKEQGGDLPDRREQSLLYTNLKEKFQGAWYWSSAQHGADDAYAWCQHFSTSIQGLNLKDIKLRARAVRRLVIQ